MLFHLGALRRLNEFGLLSATERFSSVSGGSIVAAALAISWERLDFGPDGIARNFHVVEDALERLARVTIDLPSGLLGLLPVISPARALAARYRRRLLGEISLRDLPERPRFTFNTTNVVTGGLLRWSKQYAADYRLGTIFDPDVRLADVVAASSAFPPFLSPLRFQIQGTIVDHDSRLPIPDPPKGLLLTDGGVYDNLGLQAVESFHTVLVSDGGAPQDYNVRPWRNWLSQSLRTVHIIDGQVRALRQRHFVSELTKGERRGALWTIATRMEDYPAKGVLPVNDALAKELAGIPTRLAAMSVTDQRRLVNLGYAQADGAVRSYVEPALPPPPGYPHPEAALD